MLPNTPSMLEANTIGSGFFTYSDDNTFNGESMNVYYHIPANVTNSSSIVFVFHGNGRNAKDYRDAIIQKANQYQFIAVVPEFSTSDFPGGDGYNLGNVFVDGDNPSPETLNPEEEWTFSIIEPLFDYIKERLNNTTEKYNILGHSAGGQFAHRFAMFKPNSRFETLVTSASGWYTEVNTEIEFPYGFKESPLELLSLSNLFEKKVIVQVGALDNNPNASGLRHNEFADAQGTNRLARAQYFFSTASQLAASQNIDFNWELNINEGADHNYIFAIQHASDLIFN